jgi:hypothetical protein
MKALLLRVGIDKGTDGALGPIFDDGTFVYVPPSEWDPASLEPRTFRSTVGITGRPLATYLPPRVADRVIHDDPEFVTYTYGDASAKRRYLLKLSKGDILAFYAGLQPFHTHRRVAGLYIIGHFTVARVVDFNLLSDKQRTACFNLYPRNAHLKRTEPGENLVIVAGDRTRSALLQKALLISEGRPMRNGRIGQAVSRDCERVLGVRGFIERSMPPRLIKEAPHFAALFDLLHIGENGSEPKFQDSI